MEKVREVSVKQKIDKVSFLKFSLFVLIGVCLSFIRKEEIFLFLFLPYISLCFYLGGSELFGGILGVLLSGLLISYDHLVLSSLGLVAYFLVLIITKIFPIKMKTRLILSCFLADVTMRYLFSYFNHLTFQIESILLSISLSIVTYALLYYCTALLSSKKFYHPYFLVFLGWIICLFCQLIPPLKYLDIKNVLLLSMIIFISIVGGSGIGVLTSVGVIILSYLFNEAVSNRVEMGINNYVEGDIVIDNEEHIVRDKTPEEFQELIETFQASPTCPLYGTKVPFAGGKVGEMEENILKMR